MKKLFIVLALGIGIAACGDNTGSNIESAPGGTLDSSVIAPDNTTIQPEDTTPSDTATIIDLNNRDGQRDGTSSGESGSSTNSENSGSATDENKEAK